MDGVTPSASLQQQLLANANVDFPRLEDGDPVLVFGFRNDMSYYPEDDAVTISQLELEVAKAQ